MEHYAIHLHCSPIPSLSYSSKRYEHAIARRSKFNLKFNHATLCHPQFTTNHKISRSISHTNCMINNFSMPNSKNSEESDNKILRGINGASLVFGCILGLFNFSSMMMNSKSNMAYAATHFPPKMILVGGEISFDSMWEMINADAIEPNTEYHPLASPDEKKMHALYLRKCGNKDAIKNMVDELKKDREKFKNDPDTDHYRRRALIELLLIQEKFDEACTLLDKEIDEYLPTSFLGSMKKVNYVQKINKLLKIYDEIDEVLEKQSKQFIADIFLFKAILHTKLRNKEAAKWWEAFAKTLVTE